jgi:hypothetical protein
VSKVSAAFRQYFTSFSTTTEEAAAREEGGRRRLRSRLAVEWLSLASRMAPADAGWQKLLAEWLEEDSGAGGGLMRAVADLLKQVRRVHHLLVNVEQTNSAVLW